MKIDWKSPLRTALAAVALASAPLAAGSTSGTMTVGATVEETCHLDARPMVFDAMPSERDRNDAHSSVLLACTPSASYVVTLDDGRHGEGGARRMADGSGTHFLAYELYSDAARTRRWGTATASAVSAVAPVGGLVELNIFARLSAAVAMAGEYADTVTVTVAF